MLTRGACRGVPPRGDEDDEDVGLVLGGGLARGAYRRAYPSIFIILNSTVCNDCSLGSN